jgi:hypothetical protein
MRVSTASPITRSIAIDHTIARLETLSQRQNVQLEKEHKGKRRQGKPPWPQGSRPARRIQEKINARRAAAQAIVDRIEAERLEHEAELEAERQILEQEKMLAEMEAWEKWESNGGGDSPPGSSRRWDAARNWMRMERVVQAHLQLDEECYVRLSVTASTLTPRRAARLQAAAERRTLAKLAEEEAERQRLAKEAEDARRYAALGTTRWVRADSDFNAVLIFAFLGSRGLSLDQGGWLLTPQGLNRVPDPEGGLAPMPPGAAGAVSPVREWPTAIRTSASVTGAPDSAWAARARTARLARDRARLSPLREMPPPGVSISTLKASSIKAA